MAKHYVGEIGTNIILNAGTDISTASAVKIYYTKPDGTTGSWTGSIYATNYVKYSLIAGDLTPAGIWKMQCHVTSTAWTGYGEIIEVMVYPVYEAALTGEITSLLRVKDFLNIPQTNADKDVILQKMLTSANKKAQQYAQRDFVSTSYTEYYDGDGTDRFLVNNYPITAITSIYDDTDRAYGASTLVAAADYYYQTSPNNGIIVNDQTTWGEGKNNLKIAYTAGYTALTMPSDVETAVIKLAAADYIENTTSINVRESDETNYRPEQMRKEAFEILDRYIRHV